MDAEVTSNGKPSIGQRSRQNTASDLFQMVEVEVNTRCNKRCSYCPVSIAPPTHLQRYMSPEVWERLLSQLSQLRFEGRFSYHFYNEPLLHPRLVDLVSEVTRRLPKARQVLYTNGDLLTDALHRRLVSAGVARFIVTSHDHKPVPGRDNQVVLQPEDLELTNRGGALGVISSPLDLACYAPSTMMIVTVSGDVVLCYEDYYRTHVMGNIMREPVAEIWFSPRFCELRSALAQGDRSATDICSACSNQAHQRAEVFDYVL